MPRRLSIKRRIRRYPFSTTLMEDVQDALSAHSRKTRETVVDFADRVFRKELKLPPRPKDES